MFQVLRIGGTLHERRRVSLNVDDDVIELHLKIRWIDKDQQWRMTIEDVDMQPIVTNIPLLIGRDYRSGNLLKQYRHMRIGSCWIIALVDEKSNIDPGEDDLWDDYLLLWGDTDVA